MLDGRVEHRIVRVERDSLRVGKWRSGGEGKGQNSRNARYLACLEV